MTRIFLLLFIATVSHAKIQEKHVTIDWLAPDHFLSGSTTTIGIHFKLDPQWHIYWKNPGDSGAAPKFNFESKGAQLGPIQWPAPERIPYAHLINLGYEKEAAFLFDVHPSGDEVSMTANLEWLICKEECIPGFGKLELTRKVSGDPVKWPPGVRATVDKFLKRVPSEKYFAKIELLALDDREIKFLLHAKGPPPAVFPEERGFLTSAAPRIHKRAGGVSDTNASVRAGGVSDTNASVRAGAYEYTFAVAEGKSVPEQIRLLIVGKNEVSSALVATDVQKLPPEESLSFFVLLIFSFLGGVLLNLMPCVFPVLSIKILAIARAKPNFLSRLKECLAYAAGVLVTFTFLGAIFLFLRSAGESIGWGFHLQSPLVIYGLVLLFWLMALNFLGVFHFGDRLVGFAGNSKWSSAFGTGVLSVFVATPCTGPFMGTALGAAATLPSWQAMTIFLFLGAGLASPLFALSLVPRLLGILPKPGMWMERLKQFFAFPLFATVIWLLWVMGFQVGTNGIIAACTTLLVISFCFWFSYGVLQTVLAWMLAVGTVTYVGIKIPHYRPSQSSEHSAWQPYDRQKIEMARREGRPLFIDFTAAWCITCQVNKKVVLDTQEAQELFRVNGVLLIRADWTNRDPEITKALAEFNRNSVPLYVFYGKSNFRAEILPQILTLNNLRRLLSSP